MHGVYLYFLCALQVICLYFALPKPCFTWFLLVVYLFFGLHWGKIKIEIHRRVPKYHLFWKEQNLFWQNSGVNLDVELNCNWNWIVFRIVNQLSWRVPIAYLPFNKRIYLFYNQLHTWKLFSLEVNIEYWDFSYFISTDDSVRRGSIAKLMMMMINMIWAQY